MLTQDQVVLGRRNAAPAAINWSELDGIKRGREESPADSLNKSKEAAWKFAALDPGTEEGKSPSAALFTGQIAGDIRSTLQKPPGADARGLGRLLDAARTVYRNRDRLEEKGNAGPLAALGGTWGPPGGFGGEVRGGYRGRGRGRGFLKSLVGEAQCACCKKEAPEARVPEIWESDIPVFAIEARDWRGAEESPPAEPLVERGLGKMKPSKSS